MLELILIRHPRTEANKGKIIQGQIDTELEPEYENSVGQLAEELARQGAISAFFSSDLQRAEIPARMIVDYLRKHQNVPLEYVSTPLLRERNWGELEGKKYEEAYQGNQDILDWLFYLDNIARGENFDAISERINRFKEEHLQRYKGRAGIIGHSYLLNYLRN